MIPPRHLQRFFVVIALIAVGSCTVSPRSGIFQCADTVDHSDCPPNFYCYQDGVRETANPDQPTATTDLLPPRCFASPAPIACISRRTCNDWNAHGQIGDDCGTFNDPCGGGTIECPTCSPLDSGAVVVCESHSIDSRSTCVCDRLTCAEVGAECGIVSDGCGGELNCGGATPCVNGEICSDSFQCVCPAGAPNNCMVTCGGSACTSGQVCDRSDQCCSPTKPCLDNACSPEPTTLNDGCGTNVDCGSCPGPMDECRFDEFGTKTSCVDTCSCEYRGFTCGEATLCGKVTNCGSCSGLPGFVCSDANHVCECDQSPSVNQPSSAAEPIVPCDFPNFCNSETLEIVGFKSILEGANGAETTFLRAGLENFQGPKISFKVNTSPYGARLRLRFKLDPCLRSGSSKVSTVNCTGNGATSAEGWCSFSLSEGQTASFPVAACSPDETFLIPPRPALNTSLDVEVSRISSDDPANVCTPYSLTIVNRNQ